MIICRKWLAISLVLLSLMQSACGIQISTSGGGIAGGSGLVTTRIDASKDASVQGMISITGADIKPSMFMPGPIKTFSQTHQVTDKSGKTAKVTVNVINAPNGLDYSSEVLPSEGTLSDIRPWISAEQWLTVPKADSIICSATAAYKTLSADASIAETKGTTTGDYVTLTGYYGMANASASQVYAYQTATNGSGSSIKILNHAKNGTLALGIETPITGKPATFQNLDARSYAGKVNQVTQDMHVAGKFTSTAKSGTQSKIRTSDFGTAYDLVMVASKGSAPVGTLGYYVDPTMATTTTGAIKGALGKAQAGDIINAATGSYNEDVSINKAITLKGTGGPTAKSFTLNTLLGPGSGGITAPIVNVSSSARIQDGVALTSASGTLNVAAGKYSEDVNINKGLTIVGSGNPTASSFSLTSGALLGAGSGGITAPVVNVAPGSRINDGIKLLSDSGTINVASGYYGEDVTISKALVLKGSGNPTASSFTLNTPLGSGSGGIEASKVKVNSGGKIQDGVTLSNNTVNVGPGYYDENVVVDKSLSIRGSGRSFTGVDGGQAGSVFAISSGKIVTLSDMTIRNGNGTIGINGYRLGGGIYNSGTLTVNDCAISSNSATSGGGICSSGILTVSGSTISSNSATNAGGGIYNYGTMTVSGSTISSNSAGWYGGGICSSSTATVSGSTISSNSASSGGGIYSEGTVTVSGSTISSNSASKHGGGIYSWGIATVSGSTISSNSAGWYGGGIYSYGTATVSGSTISSNSASQYGGGIFNFGTMIILGGSTLYGNTAQQGGGIYSIASLTIKEGTNIYGNNATTPNGGGGIFRYSGSSNISPDTKIYGNTPDDIGYP